MKTVNVSFANLNKSPEAFKELTLTHSRDSILLTCETPTSDNVPPTLSGYYALYNESPPDQPPPRVCAYIKNSAIDLLDKFTCERDLITIHLVDDWIIKAIYTDPLSPINPKILTSISHKTVILGDFNAKHPSWFDTSPTDDHRSLARGKDLHNWSRRAYTVERGPRLPTRRRPGERPSKLDLIWTRRDSHNFIIRDYSPLTNSDHDSIHIRLRLIRPPRNQSSPRPDMRRMPIDTIRNFFSSSTPPTNPSELDDILLNAIKLIPRLLRNPNHKLPPDLREQRCELRHLMRKRWGSNRYAEARQEYR